MENMVFTMERSGGGKALFGYMPKPNPKTMPKPNLNPNLTNTITKMMPKPNLETTPTWSKDLQQMESYWAKGISGEKTGYRGTKGLSPKNEIKHCSDVTCPLCNAAATPVIRALSNHSKF